MALVTCDNCGKDLITEADTIISQRRPDGEYISCGCVEFAGYDYALHEIRMLRDCAGRVENVGMFNALHLLLKKLAIQHDYGHTIAGDSNQECSRCGASAYLPSIKNKCTGSK